MSQVDDWADGYADSARDVNLYGPASANVPRSSVVSHQVRYRAPDTSDIPLAPGQNPEGSVYSNASGARMGQTKPASGYRAPAGGGWDVNSSDTNLRFPNESGGRRYASSKTKASAKPAAKKKTKSDSKQQPQPEYRTGGARTPEENEITRSAAEHRTGADLGQLSSQALDAAARFLPALKLLGFGAGAGSASVPETNFNRGLMGGVGRQVESMRAPDSEQPAPESSSIEDQFKNMPWYEDAKAHHEAVKKNMDDYGSALGTLKSTWDDIPWWTKLVMLPPVFKAGSPAAGASTAGNVWAEGGSAAAGDAAAGAGRAAEAAAEGRRLYGNVVERMLAPKGPLTGGARTTLTSADEGLPVGYSLLRNPKIDTSPLAGQTSSLIAQLRAAGIPEDQIAASIARINAGFAGREAAAAGGQAAGREAAAAGGQAAGREAAAGGQTAGREAAAGEAAAGGQTAGREAAAGGQAAGREAAAGDAAADGGVSELANAGSAGRVERVPSLEISAAPSEKIYGTVDEFMRKNPGGASAVQDAIEYVTGKTPEIARVAESLRLLSRDQLEQVFMELRNIGKAFE